MGLDGVELVMAVEEEFGISISDAEAEIMVTPREMISYVCEAVKATDKPSMEVPTSTPCSSQRAFYRIREAIEKTTGVERCFIQLDTSLFKLFDKGKKWRRFRNEIHLGYLVSPSSLVARRLTPKTVRDLVKRLESRAPMFLKKEGAWTKQEVREVVRQIICEQLGLGLADFSDDDQFVRDLGVG